MKGDFDKRDVLLDGDFDHVTYSNSVVPCISSLANENLNKIAGPRHILENNKSLQLVNTLSCLGIEVSEHSKIKEKTKSDKQSNNARTRRSKSMDNPIKRKTEISRRFTRGQSDSRFMEEQKFRKLTTKETAVISRTPNNLGRGFLPAETELLDEDFDNIQYTKSPMSESVVSDKRSEYYKGSPLRSSSVSRSSQLVNTLGCLGIEVSDRSKNRKGRTRTSFNNHHLHEGRDANHRSIKATEELSRKMTTTAAAYEELYKQNNNRSNLTKISKVQQAMAETGSPAKRSFDSMKQAPPSESSHHYKVDSTFIKDVDTAVIVDYEVDYMNNPYADKCARNIKRSSSVPVSYYYSHKHESLRDKTNSALHSKLQLNHKPDYEAVENFDGKPLSVTDRKTQRKRKRSKSKDKQSPRQETDNDRNSLSNETNEYSETRSYFSSDQEYQEYIKSLKQKLNTGGQQQNSDVSMQDDEMPYHYEIQDDDETDFDSNKGKQVHSVQNNINQDAGLKLDKEVDYTAIKTAVVRPLIQGKDKSRNLQNKYRSLSFSDASKKIRAHEIKYSRNKSVFPYDASFSQFPGHNSQHHLHSKHRSTVPNTVSVANFLTANCSVGIPSSLSMSLMSYKMPNSGEPPEEQDADSYKNLTVPFSREMNTENFDKEPYGLEIPLDKEQDGENTKNDTDIAILEDHKPVQSGYPCRSSSFLIQPTMTKAKQINRSKSDRNRTSSNTS